VRHDDVEEVRSCGRFEVKVTDRVLLFVDVVETPRTSTVADAPAADERLRGSRASKRR
jgi:hypothetical protein